MFENSSWIWASFCPASDDGNVERRDELHVERRDEYAEFREDFVFDGGTLRLRISADSDYAVYVNGVYTASGQYGDFEYWKVADEVDLTPFCRQGSNTLAVVAWYWGEGDLSVYRPEKAGVIYELFDGDGRVMLASGEATRSRISVAYKNHYRKTITMQLGKSFLYDASKEDDWMVGAAADFTAGRVVDKPKPAVMRPISKLVVGAPVESKILKNDGDRRILLDLGEEYAGYIDVDMESDEAQNVVIAYGEHIARVIADDASGLQPTTLSMACFKYDALLMVDRERYKDFILDTIEKQYTVMLEAGSTTVWEDFLGESAYDGRGSLCHGWSAIPIYYFHTLL